jgi:hypothetical protein
MKYFLNTCLIAACLIVASSTARAQMRIYAVSGKVTAVNPKIQTTEVATDDGTSSHFRWVANPAPSITFDKRVEEDATPADKFTTKGDHAIAYFFGDGDVRTLVAVRDLGASPVVVTTGSVIKLNRKERLLTIEEKSGTVASFHLDPRTVVDTPDGVKEDLKFDLNKGDPIRVTSAQANGSDTALLVVPAVS